MDIPNQMGALAIGFREGHDRCSPQDGTVRVEPVAVFLPLSRGLLFGPNLAPPSRALKRFVGNIRKAYFYGGA